MLTAISSAKAKTNAADRNQRLISVVIPTYNEASNIQPLLDRLLPVMTETAGDFEIIFVDDGSRDRTADVIADICRANPRVKLVRFSRNFGKEAALYAGLKHTSGDAVVQLDADLQHPPEIISQFVAEWRAGGEIVFGARKSRKEDTLIRRFLAQSFYRVFSAISEVKLMEGLGDFLLLDRKVVNAILSLPERERFTKGLYAWVGFARVPVPFEVEPRAHGKTGWNLWKLFRFAMNAITSFGSMPLKVWSYVGLILAISAVGYASLILLDRAVFGVNVRGYPALMAAICFFSGVQLMGLGIVGEYLSRVLAEVKQRPLFLVQERMGFDNEQAGETQDGEKRAAS